MATIAEQSSELRLATFRLSRRLRARRPTRPSPTPRSPCWACCSAHGTQTLTQLAERERVSAPSMNRTVNCLEE